MLDLIERLERAESGSRGLDGDIAATLRLQPAWATVHKPYQRELFTDGGPGTRAREWLAPKLTTSLDAIVALIGEKLPGWTWGVENYGQAAIGSPDDQPAIVFGAFAKTPQLALCIALLRALHTQEQRHDQ